MSSEYVSHTEVHTEVWNAAVPGGTDFWREKSRRVCVTIYSRHVRVIFEILRQNPKISKISNICLILIHEEFSKKKFQNFLRRPTVPRVMHFRCMTLATFDTCYF